VGRHLDSFPLQKFSSHLTPSFSEDAIFPANAPSGLTPGSLCVQPERSVCSSVNKKSLRSCVLLIRCDPGVCGASGLPVDPGQQPASCRLTRSRPHSSPTDTGPGGRHSPSVWTWRDRNKVLTRNTLTVWWAHTDAHSLCQQSQNSNFTNFGATLIPPLGPTPLFYRANINLQLGRLGPSGWLDDHYLIPKRGTLSLQNGGIGPKRLNRDRDCANKVFPKWKTRKKKHFIYQFAL